MYVAAENYLIPDLCEAIVMYLKHLVDENNFGDMYKLSKRIGAESLKTAIFQSWMSKSVEFNENGDQIKTLMSEVVITKSERWFDAEQGDEGEVDLLNDIDIRVARMAIEEGSDGQEEVDDNAVIIWISQKMIRAASNWDGDTGSKLCVIKCLATFLQK
jgi:hypothetical protein